MNHGFAIDTRSCIGCHACSTACKSENQVPVGVNRTWVKYTESGIYPNVDRNFQVTRCNHCENPPCVTICPVTAMRKRDDGIVEFDGDACIGCKACMQACPYDAVYIDPDSGTAAKCHFCAHRVEVGMEPACVVVCPTHAILAGDLDDPESEIARALAAQPSQVRKPEQNTIPNLFYFEGQQVSLNPALLGGVAADMVFSDVRDPHTGHVEPPYQQAGPSGPIQVDQGTMAEHMVQVAWNAQHAVPWHWPVPAYLVTKGIASGIFCLLSAAILGELAPVPHSVMTWAGGLGVLMLIATTVLLVIDLERPERFLRIIFRPQWKSWLTRGAYLLIAFSTVASVWWGMEAATEFGLLDPHVVLGARPTLAALCLPLGIGAAIYTAFLFRQCEGRDLWQGDMLIIQMAFQAIMAGAACLAMLNLALELNDDLVRLTATMLVAMVIFHLYLVGRELLGDHETETARLAARSITHGRHRSLLLKVVLPVGHVLPITFFSMGGDTNLAIAGLCALIGLATYEHIFVTAPQEIPNS
jgi:Fe-S-cluster-containing dehydrogenase component/formate-dependent nitrite reductase membrane component NrfD